MIADVKYKNEWYHDGRKHQFLTYTKPYGKLRQKRFARKPEKTSADLIRRYQTRKIETVTADSMTVGLRNLELSNRASPQPVKIPLYSTTPEPVFIETFPARHVTEHPFLIKRPGQVTTPQDDYIFMTLVSKRTTDVLLHLVF